MSRNFLLEAQMKEAAAAAGCLESALPDFEMDIQTYAVTNASEIPGWIENCKTNRPHRFAVQNDHDAQLCISAFVRHHKTDESRLYRAVGETRFNELKKLYSNGIPETESKRIGSADHKTNPWNAEGNTDARGRFTDEAIRKQMSYCRAVGPEKAAQTAAVVGVALGDLYAAGFKRAG
jgi:hypothetical protein